MNTLQGVRILIVEDNPEPLALTMRVLELRGLAFDVAHNAAEVFEKLKGGRYDLILLDLGLPDMDGLEVCNQLKQNTETVDIPVIMLTGRSAYADKIAGLEMGADDYVVKPFDPGELIARMNVVLRRRPPVHPATDYSGGLLTIDVKHRTTRLGDQEIKLTAKEFDLLALLLQTPGVSVTRLEIARQIWDKPPEESSRSLDTHVWSLRSKLGLTGRQIETVGKVGYRYNPQD